MVRRLSQLAPPPMDRRRRRRMELAIVLGAALLGWLGGRWLRPAAPPADHVWTRPALGTLVDLRLPGDLELNQAVAAADSAFAAIARVERLFSAPAAGGGPRSAADSLEVLTLLAFGDEVTLASGGALDLRLRGLVELWDWEGEPRRPPPGELAAELARRRGLDRERLDVGELHFGALAKGYAVDRALDALGRQGLDRALVNAGGEIAGLGGGWIVGVQHPRDPQALLARFALPAGQAVATSGDYERWFEQDGLRWHHLLDPATGEPARGCRSATVLTRGCAAADAWATALFVRGPRDGLALAARQPGIEALLVDEDGREWRTAGFPADLP
jgi:FAD:protein FMN transferase